MKTKMITLLLVCGMMSFFSASAQNVADYQIVPMPKELSLTTKKPFVLSASTCIYSPAGDMDLQRNAQYLSAYIRETTGLQLNCVTKKTKQAISLAIDSKIKNDEGYVLSVTPQGVTVAGKTARGVFYGLQTLRKSLPVANNLTEVMLPAVVIKDAPRFGYRGGMLDCGRHFFSIDFVKKYIDLLALHNMNVFHWHLTEDQGWRIEIKKYPELTKIGSIRKETVVGRNSGVCDGVPYGGYYTQEQAREIVKYAADRYITVIPEIDMPGHMLAAMAAYPELGCTGGPYEVAKTWGVFEDVLCLGNEKTYQFCEDVLAELMDIFPSKYINIGGDEAPHVRWEKCPKCQRVMQAQGLTAKKLQGYFTNRIEKFINSKGRRLIGWDEILDGDINQSATVMSWRGVEPGIKAAMTGHDVVMSPTTYAYFDYYQTDKTFNEPLLIGGNLPIEKTYSFEPLPDSLSAEALEHIIGVQCNLWTEYIPYPNLAEYQLLPRMAAIAEIQWSEHKKDFPEFKNRLTRLTKFYDLYNYDYAKHLWNKK